MVVGVAVRELVAAVREVASGIQRDVQIVVRLAAEDAGLSAALLSDDVRP
ncbi:hypothetical protein BZL29_5999 [Mycobacterium kansasii]|uniref:Uncharacterized protein n=1 Tax=Mycobacterium kansasii TaxID=1768 RepID=A0A1V3WRV4_MYCKA|nr:hypothetical protein BZL29_5999 [Mycobacterium kansasii]